MLTAGPSAHLFDRSICDVTDDHDEDFTMADDHDDDPDDALGELEDLTEVSHGAVLSLGGVSAQKVLLFLTNLVLTASLSVSAYGAYALAWRITRILVRFAPFGSTPTLVRFLPEYRDEPKKQDRVVGLAYLTTLVASVAIALGVGVFADRINAATIQHPTFPTILRFLGVLLPLYTFIRLISFHFRAIERIEYRVLLNRFAWPVVRLVAVSVAVAMGYAVVGVVGSIVISGGIVVVLGGWLAATRTRHRPRLDVSRDELVTFYNYALPNTFKTIGQLLRSRVDVILIGWFLTASAAGIYNVALFLTSLIAIPLIAFNQLLPPIASRLYADGKVDRLQAIYSTVTRLVFTITIALAAIQFVYRTELLALFGSEYTRGTVVLAVFVFGRIVGNGVGATGWLLLMTDHQYLRLVNSWILAILNVSASYYFVLEFGLVGAALGTAGSMAVVNLVRLGQLYYLEGLQPFDAKFLKPLGAALGMGAVMMALRPVLSGVVLLVAGTVAGVLTFLGLLYVLGIERRDRLVASALYDEYRSMVGQLSESVPGTSSGSESA